MSILEDLARLMEAVRGLDRGEIAEEIGRLAGKVRGMDRGEVLEELLHLTERLREVLLENQELRERLKARLRPAPEEATYPYEGVYWIDSRAEG